MKRIGLVLLILVFGVLVAGCIEENQEPPKSDVTFGQPCDVMIFKVEYNGTEYLCIFAAEGFAGGLWCERDDYI